jgi:hypothetical protein
MDRSGKLLALCEQLRRELRGVVATDGQCIGCGRHGKQYTPTGGSCWEVGEHSLAGLQQRVPMCSLCAKGMRVRWNNRLGRQYDKWISDVEDVPALGVAEWLSEKLLKASRAQLRAGP